MLLELLQTIDDMIDSVARNGGNVDPPPQEFEAAKDKSMHAKVEAEVGPSKLNDRKICVTLATFFL